MQSQAQERSDGNEPFLTPPLPPEELRRLVCHDDALFDIQPDGPPVFPYISDPNLYRTVFDFGCGCGRIARQLLVQNPRPSKYVGVDIHEGMINWCTRNLSPVDMGFQFYHHDVWNLGLGPTNTRQLTAPFPASPEEFSLVIAHSVFTHVYKEQAEFYLGEIARILAKDGIARTTWFLFDRQTFPMLFDFQVTLFINETDPTNAVIYDWRWLTEALRRHGLRLVHAVPPALRGHQWEIYLKKGPEEPGDGIPLEKGVHLMMCGSGVSVEPSPAAPAPAAAPGIEFPAPRQRRLLRYTGALTKEEFNARCESLPWWYHSYHFDNGFSVRGDYDIGLDVEGYGFPESMEGMRVLDIGTGAGWFAHHFEQAGAEVYTVDARGYCDFDMYGRAENPPIESENRPPDGVGDDGQPIYFSPVSRGFWIMKEILNSRVRFRNSRVYDIKLDMFEGKKFDLVFLGALLCHLRDPIGALMAAKRVCRHRVMASTPIVLGETEPGLLPRQYLPYTDVDRISWWLPNEACFRHWFLAAGFTGVDVGRQVTLRSDILRVENGKAGNGNQILRVGSAFVP